MPRYKVVCIAKPRAKFSHRGITHIEYFESEKNPKVIITVGEAIRRIDKNNLEFYISTSKGSLYLVVVRPFGLTPYIKTTPDRTKKDNLLSLDPS